MNLDEVLKILVEIHSNEVRTEHFGDLFIDISMKSYPIINLLKNQFCVRVLKLF